MRLEYTEEQERELRITEIEAILTDNLYESEIEELALEVELQFLQGNVDGYGTPIAFVGNDDLTFEVTYEDNSYYSMLIHDKEGNPILPYHNANTLEELFESYMNERKVDTMSEKRTMELKKAIIDWLFDNKNAWQRTNACREYFRPYIYNADGNFLIGGEEVSDFIAEVDKLIYG